MGNQSTTMKKLICILASAALFGACEQKTEVAPAAPAEKKTENNTTVVNPATSTEKTKEIKTTAPVTSSSETKVDTTTTTTASPNP